MLEISYQWSLGSSGGSTNVCDGLGLRTSQTLTFVVSCPANSDTVAFGIEAGQKGGVGFTRMGSTLYSASTTAAVVQLTGGLYCVRPFIIAKTASTTVVMVHLTGNSGA